MEEERGTTDTSRLNLKAAASLLDETAEQTGDIQGVVKAREAVDEAYEQSFWEGWRTQSGFYKEIGQLEQKIEQAVSLAQ